jgi:3-keto-5-aminohexanoate cleavage enzyme
MDLCGDVGIAVERLQVKSWPNARRKRMAANKVIITVAPTSNFQGKEANPALPIHPDEVAVSVRECWDAGASLTHMHARDASGIPTNDASVFRQINAAVRSKCDIIIQNSIAPANRPEPTTAEDGLATLDAYPEMASLDMGMTVVTMNNRELYIEWTRSFLERAAGIMKDRGIKPELEIQNDSNIENVLYLINRKALEPPYSFSFVMNMHRHNQAGISWSPRRLVSYIDHLPPNSLFSTLGIGTSQMAATVSSLVMGGGVRVGFEDNVYYRRGELAKNNAQLVERIVNVARDLGLEPASPAEARDMLGIPQLKMPASVETRHPNWA